MPDSDYDDWRATLSVLLGGILPCEADLRDLYDEGLSPAWAAREVLEAEQYDPADDPQNEE